LAILSAIKHGPSTYEEIAAYCDCSIQTVRNIEVAALAKLRRVLKKKAPDVLAHIET